MRLSVDRCLDTVILTTISAALMQPRPFMVRSLFGCSMLGVQCTACITRRPTPEVVKTTGYALACMPNLIPEATVVVQIRT